MRARAWNGLVVAAVAVGGLVTPARAQPTELDITVALADAMDAYRAAPTAERVTVGVRRIAGGLRAELDAAAAAAAGAPAAPSLPIVRDRSERRGDLVFRLWPAARDEERGATLALEMGALRAHFAAGELTALHTGNDAACYRAQYEPPLTIDDIARALPPLPLPQLDLALADGGGPGGTVDSLTPYAQRIVWESATVDDLEAPARVVSRGRTPSGAVVLITSPQSGRVLEFACDMAPPDESGEQPVLIVRAEPLPRPEGGAPEPEVEGRELVGAISELAPRRRGPVPGQFIAGLALRTPENEAWTLADAFAAPTPAGPGVPPARSPERIALLMVRGGAAQGADSPATAAARAAADELARLAARAERERTWGVRWWTVVVVEPEPEPEVEAGAGAERARAGAAEWGVPVGSGGVLWSESAGETLDRFAPGADAAVVVIAQDRRLVGVVPLGGGAAPGDAGGAVARLVWPRVEPAPGVEPAQENGPAERTGPE